jgi:aspartate/methionine/tyrosine aminotransferase
MRTEIVHPGADSLRYEIRQIVEIAKKIQAAGTEIIWENIGDPIAKGEQVPEWIKEKVQKAVSQNASYGYSPTLGLEDTRAYIANLRNSEVQGKNSIQIRPEDILFFNGLGDAISTLYDNLHPAARVIGPNPAYPTHSSAEAAHADAPHITYSLDPLNGWQPNLAELEQKIKENSNIAGIIIINPDNPTGYSYSLETLQKIVSLAREYKLFIISDKIYSNLAFDESKMHKLASVVDGVPAIAMRGISKEFPWPGSRCGWMEFYNRDKDASFDRFCSSLLNSKMLEVCSTTLPQQVLPDVMGDERYFPYLAERIAKYKSRSDRAVQILSEVPELIVHPAQGAFYMTPVFREGALKNTQKLDVSSEAFGIIEPALATATLDQRFVYYLLAATGICVVPLSSGFNSTYNGFRFTLLETDEQKFDDTMVRIAKAIRTYLDS